ncbi:protein kinase [Pendulispora brunnea]|uniref:Protein kinase n=1 Tax=Pendulispora brunnea TaxID=2905690 RepID=A0ABZ2JUP7_9BACT
MATKKNTDDLEATRDGERRNPPGALAATCTATNSWRVVGNERENTLPSAGGTQPVEWAPGWRLGGIDGRRFELIERLGGGGMSVVFLARDTVLDRTVAIKFLTSTTLGMNEARDRALLEAQACARLNHENIVRLFDIGVDNGMPFLVMEHLEGRSLDAIVQDEGVDAQRAVRIMIDVAKGLSQAQRAGIVHRDLKPSNVFVTKAGTVKILDFGVATILARTHAIQGSSGTPLYMSPEQWNGDVQDARSDIWAAGVMLYHLLSGLFPFPGENVAALREAIVSPDPAPSLRHARPDLPEEAEEITQRALKKNLAERYGTPEELLDALVALQVALTHSIRARGAANEHRAQSKPERRQTTVLSCSLYDVPVLSDEMRFDDIGELFDDFAEICATVVTELEGTVLSCFSPRVVACFGYPIAHEDNAQRALRAASLIVEAIRRRTHEDGSAHAARIGISTSFARTRRTEGRAASPILHGDAPLVAQWLEQRAGQNEILIEHVTHLLVRGTFHLEPLGEAVPDGATRAIRTYRVLRPKDASSRFDPAAGGALTAFVGRERELEELRGLWESTKAGKSQFALVVGEAGIGKSRLIEEHLARIEGDARMILRCQCWPYFQNSAFQPIVECVVRWLGVRDEAPASEKLDLLETSFAAVDLSLAEHVPPLAALLGIPTDDYYAPPSSSPVLLKQQILEGVVAVLGHLAKRQAMILVVEDAHWSDGSTLDLLDRLLADMVATRLLVIVSARTEFRSPWAQRSHMKRLTLQRLSPNQSTTMISFASQGRYLPDPIVEQLVHRTDGVPLFIEELTYKVADAIQDAERHGTVFELDSLASNRIPATLDALLSARLDALPQEGQDVAHLIAVLGRDATYDLIAKTSELGEVALRAGLMQLVEAGLLHQQGLGPDVRYAFKHALVKDAVYQSLLKTKRAHLHRRAANALLEHFPGVALQQPELVAEHCKEAGLHEEAVTYFEKAAQRADQRAAIDDAAAHFDRARAELRMLPESPARERREIAMQLARATGLMARGAIALGALDPELVARAERSDDPVLMVHAHNAIGFAALMAGDLVLCRKHATAALALCDAREHEMLEQRHSGMVPSVFSGVQLVWACGLLADGNRAVEYGRNAVQCARRNRHPYSEAVAMVHLACWHNYRGEFDEGRRLADETALISKEDGFALPLAMAKVVRGWSRRSAGDRGGSREVAEGVADRFKVSSRLAILFAVLACIQLEDAEFDDALRTIDHAMVLVETRSELLFEAELLRIRGEILLGSSGDSALAFEYFDRGLEVARRQQAKAWELRLACGYARLLAKLGRPDDARARLAPVVAQFTEGPDTLDLQRARALLGDLP